ncbi:MAG: hypothetical protein MZW92_62075 [Comamonadaceae bacterium]|nr:hypothetical protein [Comamonadaceae bacterium]
MPGLVRECGQAGIRGLIVISAGLPRDRPGRAGPRGRRPGRSPPLRGPEDPRPELPRRHLARPAPQRQLRRGHAPAGPRRLRLPVRGPVHVGPRLGGRGEARLLPLRLDRQHARRRLRRPHRLPRRGRGDQVHPPLHRVHPGRPEVHDRRPRLRPHEAHRRLQGRPLPRVRRRGRLAHRRPGRGGRRLRRRLPAHGPGPGLRHRRDLRLRRPRRPRTRCPRARAWPC